MSALHLLIPQGPQHCSASPTRGHGDAHWDAHPGGDTACIDPIFHLPPYGFSQQLKGAEWGIAHRFGFPPTQVCTASSSQHQRVPRTFQLLGGNEKEAMKGLQWPQRAMLISEIGGEGSGPKHQALLLSHPSPTRPGCSHRAVGTGGCGDAWGRRVLAGASARRLPPAAEVSSKTRSYY